MSRWKQAEEIFVAVADLSLADRNRYLDTACASDPELREEVESLLDADARNGDAITATIQGEALAMFTPTGAPGTRVGSYRITSELGRGGMGTVFLAVRDDDQFKKEVAIKVIRPGMDTEDVLSRFRHERQILANLDHTYISRLLDGGTTPEGRPFLVMEYVQGEPLDIHCEKRSLDLPARIRLFLKVCEAVSYAHRNLVVHRDLKPSNILVSQDGSPKLLDFGVAKLLTPDPDADRTTTHAAVRIVTPDYSSPEQIRGVTITTVADVYSLGAILYELLCGVRPHRFTGAGLGEVERVVCEVEPERPSEVAKFPWREQLRGDLDAIINKAMRKEAELRYASVEQFADDLQRFLNGYPVLARQGDVAYRTRKFLRRNRTAIAAGAVFVAVIIGGAAAAAFEAHRANLERQRADRRFEEVRQLSGKFLLDFHDAIADLPGSTPARKMVVETGLKYFDILVQEAAGNRDLLEEIARGYVRLGDVQGNPYEANLGDYAGALQSYKKAAAIRARIVDPSSGFLRDRIIGDAKLAEWSMIRGDGAEADRLLKAAIELGEHDAAAADYHVRAALSRAYYDLGDLKVRLGTLSEAIQPYQKGIETWTQLSKAGRDPAVEKYGISVGHSKLGDALIHMERGAEAFDHLHQALEIDVPLSDADPHNRKKLRKVYIDYLILSNVSAADSGKGLALEGESRKAAQAAADIAERIAAADPNDTRALTDIRSSQEFLGDILRREKDPEGALVHYRRALKVAETMDSTAPNTVTGPENLVMAHHRMARGLVDAGRPAEALEHVRKAYVALARARSQSSLATLWKAWEADLERVRALAHAKAGNWPEAIAAYKSLITASRETIRQDPKNDDYWGDLRTGYSELADCYAATGQWKEASAALQSALDTLRDLTARRPLRTDEEESRRNGIRKLALWKAH